MEKKIKIKIKINEHFTVKVRTVPTGGSNYNKFASIFRKGEKTPTTGTSFKDDSTPEQIKAWATDWLNSDHNNQWI